MSILDTIKTYILEPHERDEIISFLDIAYVPREPTCLGLSISAEDMHPYLANVIDSCLPGNISVGMREKATGRLVGVMLNVIITPETDDVIQLGDYPTEKCRLYREMMEQLCLGTNVLRDFGKKKQFEFFLLTTHPDYSGKGLGKELIRVSEGICKENGCDVASIQASNPITEIIVSKMGFKVIKSFDVTSFKSKEGKQILDGTNMNGTTHFTYLIKEY